MVRDATIQRFKYTYELAWKMVKRQLDWLEEAPSGSLASKQELFREATKAGLIVDAERWFDFHRARNETPHSYDAAKAEEVYAVAVRFAPEARWLLTKLTEHHG